VPLFGRRLGAAWDRVVEVKGNLRALLEPYTANLEQLMTGAARGLAHSLVKVLLSLIVATMFWTNGDGPVSVLYDALRRFGGFIAFGFLGLFIGPTLIAIMLILAQACHLSDRSFDFTDIEIRRFVSLLKHADDGHQCPGWVVCHERIVCIQRCGTVREMKEGPSRPAVRCRSQATASCCRQERWW
jgi:hypothetical protein